MKSKYVLLKANWGVVIFLDIEEIKDSNILSSDVLISSHIYLRVGSAIQEYEKKLILKYGTSAFKSLEREISRQTNGATVCLLIKSIDFADAHFQEEGIYCAFQQWIGEYYAIDISHIPVFFDKEQNKYIFEIPDFS